MAVRRDAGNPGSTNAFRLCRPSNRGALHVVLVFREAAARGSVKMCVAGSANAIACAGGVMRDVHVKAGQAGDYRRTLISQN